MSAQDSYRIKSGDVLRIEVLEDSTINRETLVLPDGRVSVPLVGTIVVGGRSVDDVRADLVEKLRPNFASDPTVFVSLSQLAEPRPQSSRAAAPSNMTIYVLGEVATPGAIELKRNTTVLQALAAVGGFSRFAATKRVQLRRTDSNGAEKLYRVNYEDILAGKSSIGTTVLKQGDVIIVPQRKLFE
ncbi:polysaccharide biosynthesis/export family protein [Arenibacterium sp. CAU 1754]